MSAITIKTMGMGFGDDPVEISVRCQGTTVFEGVVITRPFEQYMAKPRLTPPDLAELFQFETVPGVIDMEYEVTTDGLVIFGSVLANRGWIDNPVYTKQELEIIGDPATDTDTLLTVYQSKIAEPFSEDVIQRLTGDDPESQLRALNLQLQIVAQIDGFATIGHVDCRKNVQIDGEPLVPVRTEDTTGTWFYRVHQGQTMSFDLDLTVLAG